MSESNWCILYTYDGDKYPTLKVGMTEEQARGHGPEHGCTVHAICTAEALLDAVKSFAPTK